MIRLRYLPVVMLAMLLTASIGFSAEKGSFNAKLSGNESVPRPVKSPAKGEAKFKVINNGKELTYKLTITNIKNVTGAYIHLGKKGNNGPPVASLFAGPKKAGKFSGVLAEGVISNKNLIGYMMGKSVDALVKHIKSGNAYVNVHTDGNPGGEIRGQIK